ncbi:MAG: transporter substrate-binding domain-containing protein [Clostridiales bacterium]|nr:transporter substrate-binding domain-containing protein [Clostridiales bacterium]
MKKRILAVLLILALTAVTLSGCAGSGGLLKQIRDRGYITVGTEGTWSPYTYHNEADELVGFDVEVAKYIADYIGVDIRFTETAWSSIFAALDAGQIDIVANGVSYNEERAEKYDFSTPYNYTQFAVMTLADNDSVNSLADVAGKVSSNDPTSTIGQFAEANGVIFDEVKEAAQAISEVKNGRAEITFSTTVGFADYFKQHPEEASLFKVIVVSDPEPDAYIPVLKGNEDLVKLINEALEKARQDGTLSNLAQKYFNVDTTKG